MRVPCDLAQKLGHGNQFVENWWFGLVGTQVETHTPSLGTQQIPKPLGVGFLTILRTGFTPTHRLTGNLVAVDPAKSLTFRGFSGKPLDIPKS